MSVEKQVPSLCKFFSFYEEIPEESLDETDVGSNFHHKMFDISQSQQRIVRVSRGSNKKLFAINVFQVCDLKTQQRYILQEEVNISKRELTCLVDSLRVFLKTLVKLASAYRFPYQSPKLSLDLQSHKTISLLITITISLNIQIDNFVYHSDLETSILASFPSKILNCTAVKLFLRKLSTLTIDHLYKNRYYVANKSEIIESNYNV